jgi:hypothetical protein
LTERDVIALRERFQTESADIGLIDGEMTNG